MAASKLVNCLLIILLINIIEGGIDRKPHLNNEHNQGEPSPRDSLSQQNDPNTIRNSVALKRYKCHSCEPPDCSRLTTCTNAVQCWKSRVRESSGEESVARGCTTNSEQLPLICQLPSLTIQHKRHASGQFQIDCCLGDFCNAGDFPELNRAFTIDKIR